MCCDHDQGFFQNMILNWDHDSISTFENAHYLKPPSKCGCSHEKNDVRSHTGVSKVKWLFSGDNDHYLVVFIHATMGIQTYWACKFLSMGGGAISFRKNKKNDPWPFKRRNDDQT